MNNFSISEFIIDKQSTKVDICVVDKILRHHIAILQPIRNHLGCAIIVSDNSGYRSLDWELDHGRSGNSQHVFLDKGTVDLRCGDRFKTELLLKELQISKYKRVCYYPDNGFIHCDHYGNEKVNFICDSSTNNKWKRI